MASLAPLSQRDFAALAEFRYRLRRFMRFSEMAARTAGITTQQYQLLLQIRGQEKRWALIGELAERLQTAQHGIAMLVTRCERAGLVQRRSDPRDGRQVRVVLTRRGANRVERVARLHKAELSSASSLLRALPLRR